MVTQKTAPTNHALHAISATNRFPFDAPQRLRFHIWSHPGHPAEATPQGHLSWVFGRWRNRRLPDPSGLYVHYIRTLRACQVVSCASYFDEDAAFSHPRSAVKWNQMYRSL